MNQNSGGHGQSVPGLALHLTRVARENTDIPHLSFTRFNLGSMDSGLRYDDDGNLLPGVDDDDVGYDDDGNPLPTGLTAVDYTDSGGETDTEVPSSDPVRPTQTNSNDNPPNNDGGGQVTTIPPNDGGDGGNNAPTNGGDGQNNPPNDGGNGGNQNDNSNDASGNPPGNGNGNGGGNGDNGGSISNATAYYRTLFDGNGRPIRLVEDDPDDERYEEILKDPAYLLPPIIDAKYVVEPGRIFQRLPVKRRDKASMQAKRLPPLPSMPPMRPRKPIRNPRLSMIPCGLCDDDAGGRDLKNGTWRNRSGEVAFCRINRTLVRPDEGEPYVKYWWSIVASDGSNLSHKNVWFSEDFLATPMAARLQEARVRYNNWWLSATQEYNAAITRYEVERKRWEEAVEESLRSDLEHPITTNPFRYRSDGYTDKVRAQLRQAEMARWNRRRIPLHTGDRPVSDFRWENASENYYIVLSDILDNFLRGSTNYPEAADDITLVEELLPTIMVSEVEMAIVRQGQMNLYTAVAQVQYWSDQPTNPVPRMQQYQIAMVTPRRPPPAV